MNKEERDKFIGKILAIIICIIIFGGPIVFLIHDIYVCHKPVPQETINQYEAVGFKVDKIINPEKCKYVIIYFKLEGHDYILVSTNSTQSSVGGITHNPKCNCFKKEIK